MIRELRKHPVGLLFLHLVQPLSKIVSFMKFSAENGWIGHYSSP
jgi:hypothetical protein